MGEVLEMKRKVSAQINRFGYIFAIEYMAGRNPALSDPQAALLLNGAFVAWVAVSFHDERDWEELSLDLSDEHILVTPEMLGMAASTSDVIDHRFLAETEEYLLALLGDGLVERLQATAEKPPEGEEAPEEPVNLAMTPMDRGRRAAAVWHEHGKNEEHLPELVSIEVYDALEHMGFALSEALDEMTNIPRESCGELVRNLVADTLSEWRKAST